MGSTSENRLGKLLLGEWISEAEFNHELVHLH